MRFLTCLAVVAFTLTANTAVACPACGPQLKPTWSERLANSDAAALVQWVSAVRGSKDGKAPATSRFKVLQIARDSDKLLKKGGQIAVPKYIEGEAGVLFFLFGKKKGTEINWNRPKKLSETAYHYITQAPTGEVAGPKRLRFSFPATRQPNA